jgi:hypothetical protein
MDKIAFWLEEFGCTPQRWNEPGLFMPGEYIFPQLKNIANSVDAAILIFGEDDKTWCRGGIVNSPRDNILIEYGLFSSILGPKRTIIVRVSNSKMPTDIDGIVYVNISDGKFEGARLDLKTWAERTKHGLDLVGSLKQTRNTSGNISTSQIFQPQQFITLEPRLIVASDPSSTPHASSDFLKGSHGGFSMWVELPKFGEGIRHLVNNRYLMGHATNDGKSPYLNVVGLCRGPRVYEPPLEPRWKLWLVDHEGKRLSIPYEDTEGLQPGWHLFTVRWNHELPILELLIDGLACISVDKYLEYWPSEYAQTVTFGSWPYRWSEFYLNGRTNRICVFRSWPSDEWIQNELLEKENF